MSCNNNIILFSKINQYIMLGYDSWAYFTQWHIKTIPKNKKYQPMS